MDVTLIKTYKHPLSWLYLACIIAAIFAQGWDPRSLVDTQEYWASINYYFHFESLKIDPMSGDRWMFVSRRTPGYPFLLFFFGGFGTLLIQGFAAILSPFVCLKMLSVFNRNVSQSLFWVLWITFPLQFFYSALPMPEILVQYLLISWIWLLISQQLFKSNLVLALLLLFKPIFIVLGLPLSFYLYKMYRKAGPPNGGWFGFSWIKNTVNPQFRWKTLSLVFPIIALFSVARFHKLVWGIFHISSVGTTNFYEYNRVLILQKVKGMEYTDSLYHEEAQILNKISNLDPKKGEFLRKKSAETLRDYPLHYALLHFKGMIQMAVDPGRYDAMVFFKWPSRKGFLGVNDGNISGTRPVYEWAYIGIFATMGLLKFALFGWILILKMSQKRAWSALEVLLLLSLFAYAFGVGAVGTARYLLPLYPLIIVFLLLNFPNKKYFKSHAPNATVN